MFKSLNRVKYLLKYFMLLQPENILLDETNRVVVSDFGFAITLLENEKIRGEYPNTYFILELKGNT